MKIRDVLSPNDIMIDVRASDKTRLLRHLSAQAASELGLDPDEVSTLIAEREELGSTGVGNGVALPHARLLCGLTYLVEAQDHPLWFGCALSPPPSNPPA